MTHDHHAHDAATVRVAVLTVSSSRERESDQSGDAIASVVEDAGHAVAARDLVTDDAGAIRGRVEELATRGDVDAVVTTGGTGITDDDVTVEAVRPLFDREIPGFGEQFRTRSVEEVGPHAMLSRATAGTSDGVAIFCLPGSENGARFGTEALIAPVIGHVVGLLSGDGHGHEHSHGHESAHDHDHDHEETNE